MYSLPIDPEDECTIGMKQPINSMQVTKTRSGSKTSFVSEIDNLVNEKMTTEKHTTEKQTTEQYGTSKPTSIVEEVQDKESQLIPVKELSDTPKDN